ncbi:bifunctional diguanylate cyclase/phosphodiesterase [Salinisphaera sp. SPP-AMP-43]|uniref:putative bifunctional diguanylate cyclase/phosphodiesterase n=1 Tax=Salinisphaera sp. SPP-AMP-43 TaxID=3121288 RepID=UPI003C6E5A46
MALVIALVVVAVATVINAFITIGSTELAALGQAQADNPLLWLLDMLPLLCLVLGQYYGRRLSAHDGCRDIGERCDVPILAEIDDSPGIDPLTGLTDRSHFFDRLEHAIEAAAADAMQLGLIAVDLDGFSEINQRYGAASGDCVLATVARRLKGAVPNNAVVGRLNADYFGVFILPLDDPAQLRCLAEEIQQVLKPACQIDRVSVSLAASIGGACYPTDARGGYTLLGAAEQAMSQVKARGGGFALPRSAQPASGVAMHSLSMELPRAIEQDELVLHLQPLVDVAESRIYGVEALVRWQHPRRGLIMPGEFIARAERSGLMRELTLWVLRAAIAHIAAIRRGGQALRISVNVPAHALLRSEFPDVLHQLLAEQKVPGSAITLEITEDTLMADQTRTLEIIQRLAAMGVDISIDDFGTGYSQLAYLKRVPAAEIKIDRSFVQDMLVSETDHSIVAATIGLAHALKLRAVGEGVESLEQLKALQALGCDLAQGYYLGRPMPVAQFKNWLAERSTALTST